MFGAFSALWRLGHIDSINLGLILQGDWFRRGGLQWVALVANGFVTFSLEGLVMTLVFVLVGVAWIEKRLGSTYALVLVLALAWSLGPIKIALGGPGAVGPSKFTLMLQTFWLADNPLLLWLAGRFRDHAQRIGSLGLGVIGTSVRHLGWLPAAWLGWGHFVGTNPAHAIAVATGAILAILMARRKAPWSDGGLGRIGRQPATEA